MNSISCPEIEIDEDGIRCSLLSLLTITQEADRNLRRKIKLNSLKDRADFLTSMNSRSAAIHCASGSRTDEQTSMDSGYRPEINEEGIIFSILSSLTLREAVRTSVVSPRWRNIWNYLPVLNFDVDNIFSDQTLMRFNSLTTIKEKEEFLLGKTEHFIQSVDSVVQQHRGVVDTFFVRYFLPKKHTHHLDSWIKVAVALKTKKLFLFLGQIFSDTTSDLYDFPFHLIASSSMEELCLSFCSLRPPLEFDGLHHLKIMNMWGTYATVDNLNCLLSNCSSLKILCVVRCKGSVVLNIPHSLNQLRRLIIKDCNDFRRIEIDNANLEFLCYEGHPVNFIVTPSLHLRQARFYLRPGHFHSFNFLLDGLARKFSHLTVLALNVSGVFKPCIAAGTPKLYFGYLKQLDWECPLWNVGVEAGGIYWVHALLSVAPFLRDLNLTFSMPRKEVRPCEILSNMVQCIQPHSFLRTVRICGFYYQKLQLEIVLCLFKWATELESMVLEMGQKKTDHKLYKEINEDDIQKLIQEVPINVKFSML